MTSMNLDDLRNSAVAIEKKLGYVFKNKNLLILSFLHSSFVNENRKLLDSHNERLEFLGDSVLGSIVSEYLYNKFEHLSEGDLSSLKASIVESNACSLFFQKLQLQPYILLGKGEREEGGRGKESIFANTFEALIGAIFLDGGFEAAKNFLISHFAESFNSIAINPIRNYKAELQSHYQKKLQKPPTYKVVEASGPDHSKQFKVVAIMDDRELGTGVGSSKKDAEQQAAKDALKNMEIMHIE